MKHIGITLLLVSNMAFAFSWDNLWKTPDQQAAAIVSKDPEKAARLYTRPDWKGVANYRSGHYQDALQAWSSNHTELGYYNRGNALAHLGDYEAAIQAYQAAIKLNPSDQDAIYNKALLEKLLKQKKQEEQSQSRQDQKKSDQKKEKNKSQADKSNKREEKTKEKPTTSKENQRQKQEQKQADQQWLNQIPDEPAGLLQRKFRRDHQRYQQAGAI